VVIIKIIFGNAENMKEIDDNSIHLIVTSPPYYNAPFDFPNLFNSYDEFLKLLKNVGKELIRVLKPGRCACFVTQDVRIEGKLYPIVSDLIHIMVYDIGFEYQDKIIWKKPEGYIRISRRSGVIIQHPYPMYYYPDNIYEEIVVFKKPGEFDRSSIIAKIKEKSKINTSRFQNEKWYLSVWDIKNVLPHEKWSKYTAAFPEQLIERLVLLYSYYGETVLDPFLGTGTTCLVAKKLGRNCIGYEIDLELKEAIEERLGLKQGSLTPEAINVEIIIRDDAKRLRTQLRNEIEKKIREKSNN
jgi:site-specific DNA-methyltransferase (adenine-specific)/site-specific DNA-methyltransferase (cytosine-N4-specific)